MLSNQGQSRVVAGRSLQKLAIVANRAVQSCGLIWRNCKIGFPSEITPLAKAGDGVLLNHDAMASGTPEDGYADCFQAITARACSSVRALIIPGPKCLVSRVLDGVIHEFSRLVNRSDAVFPDVGCNGFTRACSTDGQSLRNTSTSSDTAPDDACRMHWY
ncbi:hypothetical protein [Dokdonella sp.]|uniref:hypothetical protein n=1 Tax=Dokdonella sp. TaxID=2291710 RepID=UPI003C58FD9A